MYRCGFLLLLGVATADRDLHLLGIGRHYSTLIHAS